MSSTSSNPPMPTPGQRSLAAIVFTDVVSFSARMQADEENTLRLLRRDFEAMREICTQHQGSVLKTTGDGLLLYFSSAVQAVACALAMQRAFAEHSRTRTAAEHLPHRVGIHLGDVFVNDQDVMGDGVNIAARLQAEAEPGGICISQTVYDVVRNKLAMKVTRLGPRELKNISQSIPIYRLLLEATAMSTSPMIDPFDNEHEKPALSLPRLVVPHRWRRLLIWVGAVAAAIAGILAMQALGRRNEEQAKRVAAQAALSALITDEASPENALLSERVTSTLAHWRNELQDRRSAALESYNLAELTRLANDPKSPIAGKPEARMRAATVQRIGTLMNWLTTALQKYSRERPLIVRELTETSPKEIRVFVGKDRRLYYLEGGAIRQRDWQDLRPSVLAAIVAGAIVEADPLPPRDVAMGALAFSALYNLPELPLAVREGRGYGQAPQ